MESGLLALGRVYVATGQDLSTIARGEAAQIDRRSKAIVMVGSAPGVVFYDGFRQNVAADVRTGVNFERIIERDRPFGDVVFEYPFARYQKISFVVVGNESDIRTLTNQLQTLAVRARYDESRVPVHLIVPRTRFTAQIIKALRQEAFTKTQTLYIQRRK